MAGEEYPCQKRELPPFRCMALFALRFFAIGDSAFKSIESQHSEFNAQRGSDYEPNFVMTSPMLMRLPMNLNALRCRINAACDSCDSVPVCPLQATEAFAMIFERDLDCDSIRRAGCLRLS